MTRNRYPEPMAYAEGRFREVLERANRHEARRIILEVFEAKDEAVREG